MKFFVSMTHHQRLLAVGLLSLLLHLAAIALLDARLGERATTIGDPAPALALRLALPVADLPTPDDAAADLPPAPPAPVPPPPAPPLPPQKTAPPLVAPGPAELPAAPAPAPVMPVQESGAAAPAPGLAPPVRLPGIYRVAPPPSGRIAYRITQDDEEPSAEEPAPSASMAWTSDGLRYQVELDGLLGSLYSTGQVEDTGIAPARLRSGTGPAAVETVFDQQGGAITVGPHDQPFAHIPGSQDTASLLLQLAGMGLANPGQLRGTLEFWVGGAQGAGIERYAVLGPARIATGAGEMDTVRLARLGKPGEPQLELWLAPAHAWLPVQLRVTTVDGAARTQTLAAITLDPGQPGDN